MIIQRRGEYIWQDRGVVEEAEVEAVAAGVAAEGPHQDLQAVPQDHHQGRLQVQNGHQEAIQAGHQGHMDGHREVMAEEYIHREIHPQDIIHPALRRMIGMRICMLPDIRIMR